MYSRQLRYVKKIDMWNSISTRFYKIFFLLFFFHFFTCFRADSNITPQVKIEDLSEEESNGHSLQDTLKRNLTGLSFESAQNQVGMKQNAQWFARTRLDWRYASVREKAFRLCEKNSKLKPFCIVLKDFDRKEVDHSSPSSLLAILKSMHNRYEIRSWIQNGNVERLSSTSESEVRAVLRNENVYSHLQRLVSQSISLSSCKNTALNQMLATKLEEFLPDLTVQTAVMKLYEKAASCGDSENASRAKYRLSLFYIAKEQCKVALPYLNDLATRSTNIDYRSRALFWKIQCQGASPLGEQSRRQLVEKYPFNFHTLLVQKENVFQKLPLTLKSDSKILFRTEKNPHLNEKVRVIEALWAIQEVQLAQELMDRIQNEVDKTEPKFRLYMGVLYSRFNYHIKNFRLLSKVFRENPELISKSSLKVYFPKNPVQGNALRQNEMDAKLLLSLIRQESAFNSRARSSAGAIGLMQVMPATARRFERIKKYDRLFEPAFNLKIGSKYFAGLLERFGGDAELALAAYNAGPRRVDQWLVRYPVKNRILFLDLIPFKETREYVASIARNYFWYAHLYSSVLETGSDLKGRRRVAQQELGEVFRFLGTPGQVEEKGIP